MMVFTRKLVSVAVLSAVAVMTTLLVQASPAHAGELTGIVIQNNSEFTVTIQVSTRKVGKGGTGCNEPSMYNGFGGSTFTIPPGFSFSKELARQNGYGCDGKNAILVFKPFYQGRAYPPQDFFITGSGDLLRGPQAKGYGATGLQVTRPNYFEWQLFMDSKDTPTSVSAFPKRGAFEYSETKAPEYFTAFITNQQSRKRLLGDPGRWVFNCRGTKWCSIHLLGGGVLTQTGSTVSIFPHNPANQHQQWSIDAAGAYVVITNRGSKLVVADGGRVIAEPKPGPKGLSDSTRWYIDDAGRENLAKLTLEEITAIHVSTGQDEYTAALFKGIEIFVQIAAAVVSGGASVSPSLAAAAAKQAAHQAAIASVKAAVRKAAEAVAKKVGGLLVRNGVKTGARAATVSAIQTAGKTTGEKILEGLKKAGKYAKDKGKKYVKDKFSGEVVDGPDGKDAAEKLLDVLDVTSLQGLFNKVYGTSPDELYITANGSKIWPSGRRDVKVKEQDRHKLDVEYIFDASQPLKVDFWEYDVGSDDDNLGFFNWSPSFLPVRYVEVLVRDDDEGSLYKVTYKVESFPKPVLNNDALVGKYQATDVEHDYHFGEITESKGKLFWTDGAKIKFSLTPKFDDYNLVTGRESPFRAIGVSLGASEGFDEFALTVFDNKVTGFSFIGKQYVKLKDVPKNTTPDGPKCSYRDIETDEAIRRDPGGTFTDSRGHTYRVDKECALNELGRPQPPWARK